MKNRNGTLDLMKFLFALMIVMFHGKGCAVGEPYLFRGGNIAVEFFFIVSGCLMAATATKKEPQGDLGWDTLAFMKHKLKGLMPNYYVAFAIAFTVLHCTTMMGRNIRKDLLRSVWELLLVTNVGLRQEEGLYNGPAWYLSAMLFAMFILWPLMRKYKNTFYDIMAPITVLFLMGTTYQNWRSFGFAAKWLGFGFKGTVRAFLAILVGCIVYKAAVRMRTIPYTKLAKILLSFLEFMGYATIFACSYRKARGYNDWLEILILAVSIAITFSNVSLWADCFQKPIFRRLGIFSYSLFLGHGCWANTMVYLFPELTYWTRLPIYLALSVGTGLVIYFVSIGLCRLWGYLRVRIVPMLIEQGSE